MYKYGTQIWSSLWLQTFYYTWHIEAETKWPSISQWQFQMHFLEWNYINLIKTSLKLVARGPINNIPAMVQVMDWRRSGDKPLSEPMMISLLRHICVTQPQWVNDAGHQQAQPWLENYTCFSWSFICCRAVAITLVLIINNVAKSWSISVQIIAGYLMSQSHCINTLIYHLLNH